MSLQSIVGIRCDLRFGLLEDCEQHFEDMRRRRFIVRRNELLENEIQEGNEFDFILAQGLQENPQDLLSFHIVLNQIQQLIESPLDLALIQVVVLAELYQESRYHFEHRMVRLIFAG